MNDKPTRRSLLRTVAAGGASGVLLSGSGLAVGTAMGTSDTSQAAPNERLLRVLNNSTEDGETTVRIKPVSGDDPVREYTLNTAGGNRPDLRTKPGKAKIPEISAEISSFDGLARGTWLMEITHGEATEEVRFEMGPFGLVDGNVVQVNVLPGGRLRVNNNHGDLGMEV